MLFNFPGKSRLCWCLKNVFFLAIVLSSCTIPRKYQKSKPFLFRNNIEVKGGNFTKDEKADLKLRLLGQLNDSAKVTVRDVFFFLHFIDNPAAFDTGYASISAKNMKASMLHLGYYKANVSFKADTTIHSRKQKRVTVNYVIEPGNPTLIDTVSYDLSKPELQQLALQTESQSTLIKGKPITRTDVLNETARLVDLYRNNGYYKFTSDDIRVMGDTTIAALTNVSDDPFENLALIAEANKKRDQPTIKLDLILNPDADTNHLKKFYVNNIYIYPDYTTENANDTGYTEKNSKGYTIRYHKKLFRNSFLVRNMYFKKGDIYNQDNYTKTLNSLSKAGVWQSVNIQLVESQDSSGKIDPVIQLLPGKKYGFQASTEASYSTNGGSNIAAITTTGNLLGIAGDLSLENRNIRKEAIKMTNTLHAGTELNLNTNAGNNVINSNEVGFTNSISFPRIVFPWLAPFIKKTNPEKQSFISTSISYVDRINLFNLQNMSFAMGWQWGNSSKNYVLKPVNVEFSYLYNQSQDFQNILDSNQFLKYSFNTALVMGSSFGYTSTYINPKHLNRQRNFKLNTEESGYPLFIIPFGPWGIFKNYMRQFVKTDVEYTYNVAYPKTALVLHLFGGIGAPISNSKNDSSLPFFKQYYSGGSNSMRGWPIRGIGIGGQALTTYQGDTTFSDRTGDIKLEANFEYRYNIMQIIPNTLSLKGALFIDVGNIWDFKNTTPGNNADSLQFSLTNLYKQLGVDIGTGFRFDFNYFLIRFDLGFRVKRPDVLENAGWQIPNITFANLFKRGVNDENRIWRYNNFNFTIGIGYPF